jgi:peptide/nickel transport system substrate-binding protein
MGATASATDATTVVVKFSRLRYQEWQQWLYNSPIVPEHIWRAHANENILKFTNMNGVGTGPYLYESSSDSEMVWKKNANWWAAAALGLDVKPKYIVDLVNSSTDAAIASLTQGKIDLCNMFLPDIASMANNGQGLTTYYPSSPYMISSGPSVLIPNVTKKPLNDPEFRLALATAINIDDIVNKAYGNTVKASDPTGLTPNFSKYIDTGVSSSLGFSFNTVKAKSILAAAGYKAGNNGMVTNKNGSPLKLTLEVPDGWSDWMAAADSIAGSARLAGINIEPQHLDYNTVITDRNRPDGGGIARFDLTLNNDIGIGSTPWTWYDYVFHQPLPTGWVENRNYEGYENDAAWALVQQLDNTPVEDQVGMKKLISQLQTIQLTDVPVIPLWYNGVWSQVSNSVWTGWPADGNSKFHYLPATWNGYWQMGAVLMLTQITPVGG